MPESGAELGVALRRHAQPPHVEPDGDHLDLRRRRHVEVDEVVAHLVGHGHDAVAGVREAALDEPERALLARAEVPAQDVAVERVHHRRRTRQPRRDAADGARLRAVRVDDVGPQADELAPALRQRAGVVRSELARHRRQDDTLDPELVGERLHRALGRARLAVQEDRVPAEIAEERGRVDGLQDGAADRQA